MPRYDYICECGLHETKTVRFDERLNQECSHCQQPTEYQFPVGAVDGIQFFEPYFDEVLDGDVTSKRDKQLFLKNQGLIERGDKVRGGRNFDKHAPGGHIKPLPPRGVSVWENQARNNREIETLEKRRAAAGDE